MLLASSRDTQNGPDWQDIARALQSFEDEHTVVVTVMCNRIGRKDFPDLELNAVATALYPVSGGARDLASVSVRCRGANVRTLEGAILYLLYGLDFKLASPDAEDTVP